MKQRHALVGALAVTINLASATAQAGEEESLRLIEALQLEKRWDERVVAPAIEQFIERLRKLDPSTPEELVAKAVTNLRETMAWEPLGREIAILSYSKCDDETLAVMRRSVLKEKVATDVMNRAVARFKECNEATDQEVNERLRKSMMDSFDEFVRSM